MNYGILLLRPKDKFIKINLKGIEIYNMPVINIIKENRNLILKKVKRIGYADYVIFTSTLSVELFKEYLGNDEFEKILDNAREIIAIGNKTKEQIEKRNVTVPEVQSTTGIIEVMKNKKIGKVMIVRSKNGNKNLIPNLRIIGFKISVLNIYHASILKPVLLHMNIYNKLKKGDINAIIFTSSMIVKGFFLIFKKMHKKLNLKNIHIAAIGRETADALIRKKIKPDYIAESPDINECITTIIKKLNN